MKQPVDFIIIGAGIAGLYTAYQIKRFAPPNTTFLILEKNKKEWMGGRIGNDTFYGAGIVVGAGVGRKSKDHALIQLLKDTKVPYSEFVSLRNYIPPFKPIDLMATMRTLKTEYKKHPDRYRHKTFKQFFIEVFDAKLYKDFVITAGYTDFEDADIYETLYHYGMDDNVAGWTGLSLSWKRLVDTLYAKIGKDHFKFSAEVTRIHKIDETLPGHGPGHGPGHVFEITTATDKHYYYANKVVVATTIDAVRRIIPGASARTSIYQQIHGQPFLLVYAKFDRASAEIMKKYVTAFTPLTGPLQKIIPMDQSKGVYMIAYTDNAHATVLQSKGALENTRKNCEMYSKWVTDALGIPAVATEVPSLNIIAITDYYWSVGTHYYAPLSDEFKTRGEFIRKAQRPMKGMVIVGEMVSRDQGWVEGALESVDAVVTREWVNMM
jgi:hypothetical protein